MAKFCVHCGRKLEDEEVCNCTDNIESNNEIAVKKETEEEPKVNVDINKVINESIKNIIIAKNIAIKILKNPVTMMTKIGQQANMTIGLIFMCVYALLWGFIGTNLIENLADITHGILGSLLRDSIGSGYMIDEMLAYIPSVKVFWFMFFLIAVQFVTITIALLLVNSILKGNGDYKKIITIAGASKVPAIIFTVFAIILSYISLDMCIITMIVGSIMSLVLLLIGTKEALDIHYDKAVYILPIISIITMFMTNVYIKKAVVSCMKNAMGW